MEEGETQSVDNIAEPTLEEVLIKLNAKLDKISASVDELSTAIGRVSRATKRTHASMEEITGRPCAAEASRTRLPEKRMDEAEERFWKDTVGHTPKGPKPAQYIGRDCYVMLPYDGGYAKLRM